MLRLLHPLASKRRLSCLMSIESTNLSIIKEAYIRARLGRSRSCLNCLDIMNSCMISILDLPGVDNVTELYWSVLHSWCRCLIFVQLLSDGLLHWCWTCILRRASRFHSSYQTYGCYIKSAIGTGLDKHISFTLWLSASKCMRRFRWWESISMSSKDAMTSWSLNKDICIFSSWVLRLLACPTMWIKSSLAFKADLRPSDGSTCSGSNCCNLSFLTRLNSIWTAGLRK